MINKIYRVPDLGPGDGGKGGVVQALARKINASLVIKEGGAQDHMAWLERMASSHSHNGDVAR